jgi:succinate dehydrogenase/fumarate reductase flavoprotein subunit
VADGERNAADDPYQCDALIIGSGAAGMSAAVTAGHCGLNVLVIGDLGTYAGIKTDENARALDANGHAIERLYAAGNDMASIMGRNYFRAGITLGPALTFGYIAGRHIAATSQVAGAASVKSMS